MLIFLRKTPLICFLFLLLTGCEGSDTQRFGECQESMRPALCCRGIWGKEGGGVCPWYECWGYWDEK
ncbi:hypothetical protein COCSADRAFT_307629 [Bipolaris sorokiniana ND90Pr]|uniref:Uncharacterized protein n=1 Tax=Cochliobolus sativus (strain ND90Pr / ATCC 201652) TaxID=665912 RepID=M2STJ7_COCSN|nr:uncharacterized protein COCSADRAFT_307629 [Bipolaris sorokiniana ND90Pr]EMD65600.1 hypothetical protein COCSADRAFT_307629 [Bipolaris sorokiniana ND90Pr]